MSRDWLAVYTAMATKPKYRRLSPIGRGALLHVFILAGFQNPEATWSDTEELRESLILEGFPEGAYDELRGLGWLDHEDGGVSLHDWDDHQIAATLEVKRSWEAARKREWRRKKRPTSPSPAPLTPTRQDTTTQDIGPGHVPDMSRTNGLGVGVSEVVEEYGKLFGHVTEGKLVYLSNIASRWEPARIIEGLRKEQRFGATPKDICGRLEKGLKAGDKVAATETMQKISEMAAAS